MKTLGKISLDEVSRNQVLRSPVSKTQQPNAEGLTSIFLILSLDRVYNFVHYTF